MFTQYKMRAKEKLGMYSPTIFLVTLIYSVIPFLFNRVFVGATNLPYTSIGYFSNFDGVGLEYYFDNLTMAQTLYVGIASVLIGIVFRLLDYGYTFYCLKASRGHEAVTADLLEGFYRPGRVIIADILMGIRIMLWSLLFIIPGIMAAYSYSQTYRILADDPTIGANEAINLSRDMMKGHRMEYFLLQLSFFWWGVLSSITMNITDIYSTPYSTVTFSMYYDTISAGYGLQHGTAAPQDQVGYDDYDDNSWNR